MSGTKQQRAGLVTFLTSSGVEVPAVTTDQMREIDRIAMRETGPNLFQMMENAGRNLPSGLHSTTGETPGPSIQAVWTMTLALPKTGLAWGQVGQLVLADIGIPAAAYRRASLRYVPPFGSRYRVLLSVR